MGPQRLELLLLLVSSWLQCSFQQMPPLDKANLLPLDKANSPALDGSLRSAALDSGPTPVGKLSSQEKHTEGDSEVGKESPWVDLSLTEEEVADEIEEEGKVNASEDVSEEESDELTLEGEEEEEAGSSNDGELDEQSSEEIEEEEEDEDEEEKEKEEEPSLRDLTKFPVKKHNNHHLHHHHHHHHHYHHHHHHDQVCVTDTDCELISAEQNLDYKCFQYM